jgi:hypothetical protein
MTTLNGHPRGPREGRDTVSAMARHSWPLAASLASAFAVTLMARDARAIGPVDVEVAGQVGIGTDPLKNGGPNPLGFGGGGRAGVAFLGLYGGLALTYYAGGSDSNGTFSERPPLMGVATRFSSSDHALMYGVEAGYGFSVLGVLTIRPQVGVGNFTLSYAGTSPYVCACQIIIPPISGNINNLFLQPGLTALVSLGVLLVGLDANALVLPSIKEPAATSATTDVAFTTHVQVGVRF